eukprot:CAMPEP_0204336168 /NCGR_PEP_ID=MMETSP0469-20131031/19334_1 /ASSEMBLY_ACC=CAM_ASM_000384 /TAXON_ID=2969 /ORGANISM="Oxyrrhis marina" /LENGTH=106 /DNA_ID=CAMNT_0051319983 /DNA_START=6 /DNA_END=323 /DNA_ORIENTATION=+
MTALIARPRVQVPRPACTIGGSLADRQAGLTTHTSLWPASPLFCDWLLDSKPLLQTPGTRVVELGSGTGHMAATLARNCEATVVATEIPRALEGLRAGVERMAPGA